jgi:KaiC/GvpD/RAD55 family RecA-like ATPase
MERREDRMRKIDYVKEETPSVVHRHRTGLDDLMNGGLKPGNLCVLIGPSMSGRGTLARQYFYQGLKEDSSSIYVTTKNFTEDIVTLMEEKRWPLEPYTGRYVFIDAYSPQSDPSLKDSVDVKYVASVADFARLTNAIVSSMSENLAQGVHNQRVVFDSIDTVLMYVSAQGVYRFLSYLRAKIKGFRASSMFMIEPDLHEERQVRTLFQLADVVIEVKAEEGVIEVTQPGLPKRRGAFRVAEAGCVVVPEPLD